jgi:FkbM family methyltransferase
MNLFRFLKKCFTDRPAAWRSAKLVGRSFYGKFYWFFNPNKPLIHHLSMGGVLWLEPKHSFTHCFYPGVDQYEPEVREALRYLLKPGNTFIDCGANVGYFSIAAGQFVGQQGKIVAIEANPVTYNLLERNLQVNHLGIPIHCALTSQVGEVELFMPTDGGDVYSSLKEGGLVSGSSIQSFKVQGRTLDEVVKELNLSTVDLIKIDIEGAELDVLRSAPYLLSTLRPLVIMEYGTSTWIKFEATPKDLKELLQQYSYQIRLFDWQRKSLIPITEEVWSSPYANLVLVPMEKLGRLL